VNGWMFCRYMIIGLYVGMGTVFGFIWWFLYASGGPHLTWQQLINFHDCPRGINPLYSGINCAMFHDPRPSTVALSVLVLIEMFNAMNALSENQSLLVVKPWSNLWVVLACLLSLLLHFAVVYIPFLANIFHVSPLNTEEWGAVFWISFPVIFVDEILKLISRNFSERSRVEGKKSF